MTKLPYGSTDWKATAELDFSIKETRTGKSKCRKLRGCSFSTKDKDKCYPIPTLY